MSARTKIKASHLRALENGHFEELPGAFFARAFLRSYARELGVSPDLASQEYDARQPSPRPDAFPDATARDGASHGVFGERTGSWLPASASLGWAVTAGAIAVVALAAVLARPSSPAAGHAEPVQEPVPVGTTGVTTAGALPAPPRAEPRFEGMVLDLRATDLTWLHATADGRRVVYRLLQPGERVSIEARRSLWLRTGNAAALDYTVNGEPGVVLGLEGSVRTVEITPDNLRAFVR